MKKLVTLLILQSAFTFVNVQAQFNQNFFVKNAGQMADNILYVGYADGYKVIIAKNGIYFNHQQVLQVDNPNTMKQSNEQESKKVRIKSDNIKMSFVNSNIQNEINKSAVFASKPLDYTLDFLNFKESEFWIADVPIYNMLTIKGIYNDVDLIFYYEGQNIRYDFHLTNNANTDNIEMKIEGCKDVSLINNEIILKTEIGTLTNGSIKSFNAVNNQKLVTTLNKTDNNTIRFEIENSKFNSEVIIDPLIYSSYYTQSVPYYIRYYSTFKNGSEYWISHTSRIDGYTYTDTMFTDNFYDKDVGAITVFGNDLKTINKIYLEDNINLLQPYDYNQFYIRIGRNYKNFDFNQIRCFYKTDSCDEFIAIADFEKKEIKKAICIPHVKNLFYNKNNGLIYNHSTGNPLDYLTANAYDTVYNDKIRSGQIQVISADLDTVLYASFLANYTRTPYSVCTDKNDNIFILAEWGEKLAFVDTTVVDEWVNPEKFSKYVRSVLIKFDKNYNYIKTIGYYGAESKKMKYNELTDELIIAGTAFFEGGASDNTDANKPSLLAFDTDLNLKRELFIESDYAGIGLERTWIDGDNGDLFLDSLGDIYITGIVNSEENGDFDFPLVNEKAYKVSDGHEVNIDYESIHNVFITKIKSDFSKILYSTVFGGCCQDTPYFIEAQDSIITVIGETWSHDLPTTPDALIPNAVGGCLFFARFQYSPSVGVADNVKGVPLIYPNPAGNYITLSESDTKLYTDYEIYDISGRLLQKAMLNSFRIDISGLERGSYYLRLISPSGIATAGFLKME